MRFLIIVQGIVVKHVTGRDKAFEEFERIKKVARKDDKLLSVHLAQIIQS